MTKPVDREGLLARVRALARLDGTGYPDGLRGDEVPLLAQIVSVADAYDAITTVAPYQSAKSAEQAMLVLRNEVRRGWRNREVVEAFIDIVTTDPPGHPRVDVR